MFKALTLKYRYDNLYTCIWVNAAPLIVPIHVNWSDILSLYENVQNGPLQSVCVSMAMFQVKVWHTLIVVGNSELSLDLGAVIAH